MAEVNVTEIGPTNNSPEASQQRFEARQAYPNTPEGKSAALAKDMEHAIKTIGMPKASVPPDVIEEKTFLGIPVSKVKKWFKR
jgi:hypothetical protein